MFGTCWKRNDRLTSLGGPIIWPVDRATIDNVLADMAPVEREYLSMLYFNFKPKHDALSKKV